MENLITIRTNPQAYHDAARLPSRTAGEEVKVELMHAVRFVCAWDPSTIVT